MRYAFAISTFCSLPLLASFCSTEEMMRHDARPDGVLVRHRDQVALLHRHLLVRHGHGLHVLRHLVVAFSLLGELGQVHVLLTTIHHLSKATAAYPQSKP